MVISFSEDINLIKNLLTNNEYFIDNRSKSKTKFESLILENIFFRYQNSSKYAIKNLNLKVNAGDKIGIFGTTGSGKSTLVDLIMGLLQPTRGNFYINKKLINENKNNYERKFLSNSGIISHVPQMIFLADATIEENIALGIASENIDLKKIKKVSYLACADEFIENLPNRYKSFVGENGVKLSGGQRQRIGIARALYRMPELIIFDEATSALDPKTEKKIVMERVSTGCKNITIISISHKYTTLKHFSKLIEFKNGEIIKEGLPRDVITNKESS